MKERLEPLIEHLNNQAYTQFAYSAIHEIDHDLEIDTLVKICAENPGQSHQIVGTKGNALLHNNLLIYSKRKAAFALNSKSYLDIRNGIAALALENVTSDLRDSILALTILYHSAIFIDCNFYSLLDEIVSVSGKRFADFVKQFNAHEISTLENNWLKIEIESGMYVFNRTRP